MSMGVTIPFYQKDDVARAIERYQESCQYARSDGAIHLAAETLVNDLAPIYESALVRQARERLARRMPTISSSLEETT